MCNVDVLLVAASLVSIVCMGNHLHRIRTEKGSKEGGRERDIYIYKKNEESKL